MLATPDKALTAVADTWLAQFEGALGDPAAREIVYGMPYSEWKAKHQKEASPEQAKAFAQSHKHG